MAGKHLLTEQYIEDLLADAEMSDLITKLQPNHENIPQRIPSSSKISAERCDKIWSKINQDFTIKEALLNEKDLKDVSHYEGNVENFIGTVKVPVGIAGPIRVNGLHAKGDFLVPMATSEAALVASYHRGANLITAAGGATSMVLYEAVKRSPAFAFVSLAEAGEFIAWTSKNFEHFVTEAASTTNHGKLIDINTTVEGNHVYLDLEFSTGDASGQNMVTLATQAICDFIIAHAPVHPKHWYVEGNLSGDKKASARAFTSTRGKKTTAEVVVPKELTKKLLHTTPEALCTYWQMSAIGGVLSGTMGIQGHFANGLAAIYLATGQDVACVAESAIGITRFELTETGDLYASVTLPGVMVGTVGGGTGLPSQKACLNIMNLQGAGNARGLAEVLTTVLLAGELSIIAALTAGHFTRAHKKLARGKD